MNYIHLFVKYKKIKDDCLRKKRIIFLLNVANHYFLLDSLEMVRRRDLVAQKDKVKRVDLMLQILSVLQSLI